MSLTWPVAYAEDPPGCSAYADLTPEQIAEYEQMAVEFLWRWSGQQLGSQDVVVRPCRARGEVSTWYGPLEHRVPIATRRTITGVAPGEYAITSGIALVARCGLCSGSCSCGDSTAVLRLPGPVHEVTEVRIDDQVVDPSAYRIDNRYLLVRQDGFSWPLRQDLHQPLGDPDTWSVAYVQGVPVPQGGQLAAGILACELAKQATNDASCRLPKRFQAITRQGVTVSALDTFDDIDKGHTGIWLIDSWLASMTKPRLPSTVRSPDVPVMRRQTWP